MNSTIYNAELLHIRKRPVHHSFRYSVCLFGLDLDELPTLAERYRLFGYNRVRLFAIHDRDYLTGEGHIRDKLDNFLRQHGYEADFERVVLVTGPRWLNYTFNPVSFYYCYGADADLKLVVAEVNNTFRERHVYVLSDGAVDACGRLLFQKPKVFHVSPFNRVSGTYEFTISELGETLNIQISLANRDQRVFYASVNGAAQPFSLRSMVASAFRFPLSAFMTLPRIHWQAASLYLRKRLPVFSKPNPSHAMTIETAAPGFVQRICMKIVFGFFEKLQSGKIKMYLPDGSHRYFGGSDKPCADLHVKNYDFFRKCVQYGDIGLGESFTDGDWDSNNLPALLTLFAQNQKNSNDREVIWPALGRMQNRLRHLLRPNSISGSRRNIRAHYDLSNTLYEHFLDPSMTYSCAVFDREHKTLARAQQNKLQRLIAKARLHPLDHVLEIGSGWGSLAITAAQTIGCHVTTITLSQEQFERASQRVRELGLQYKVEVRLCDFRLVEGRFDKIISVEMIEALGHKLLSTFFARCERLLKPNGLLVLQAITIPDQRYESYRRGCDWIQKHIFPGGLVPSLTALTQAMTKHSRFTVRDLESIGSHYAETLRHWRLRFQKNRQALHELGFDETFQRKWLYYLSYCEAGFASRIIDTLQIVMTRPGIQNLDLSRDIAGMEKSNGEVHYR